MGEKSSPSQSRFPSLLTVKAALHESNQATSYTADKGGDPANKDQAVQSTSQCISQRHEWIAYDKAKESLPTTEKDHHHSEVPGRQVNEHAAQYLGLG